MNHFIKKYDSKNWTLCQKKDSKNGTLNIGLIELNLFYEPLLNMTQRVDVFFKMTRRIEPFLFSNMTQRIEFFYFLKKKILPKKWLKELNLFETWLTELNFFWNEKDSKNWTLLFTHRSEPFFSTWLKDWIFFWLTQNLNSISRYDSKNWERILSKMTRRIELSRRMTQSIELCVKRKDSKSGTFFWFWSRGCFLSFSTWLEELNLFSICLNELNLFKKYDSLNWTFFAKKWLKECFEKKSKKWLNELNLSVIRLTELKLRLDTEVRRPFVVLLVSQMDDEAAILLARTHATLVRQLYLRSQAIISKACKRLLVTSRWTSPTDREGSCVIWILPSTGRGTSPPWSAPRSPLRSWNMCHQCLPRHALRLLRVHQFKNKMSSPLRRIHRSVFDRALSNKLCACQSLRYRSKWSCREFQGLRLWSGSGESVLSSAPLNKLCACQSLLCRSKW